MCVRYKEQLQPKVNFTVVIVLLLLIHVLTTTSFGIAPDFIRWAEWSKFWKVVLLFLLITLTINKKSHFVYFAIVIALSIGATGVIEALKWINSGFYHSARGPTGNILSDRNHFAIALCTILPIAIFARSQLANINAKRIATAVIFLITFAILSTQSRGGVITLFIISLYFWLKSNHKLKLIPIYGVVIFLVFQLMGQTWMDRMGSIQTADNDSSFTTRVIAWQISTEAAIQNPFLGTGFKGPQMRDHWLYFAQFINKDQFVTVDKIPDRAYAAHSIYFQVLGEQGFIGFTLYILLFVSSFATLASVRRRFKRDKSAWPFQLATMLQVSLGAFAFGGLTISIAYIDLIFIIFALSVALSKVQLSEKNLEKEKTGFN